MTESVEDHEVISADIIPHSFNVGSALPDGVDITPYGVVGLPDPDDEEAKPLTDNQVDKLWRDGIQGMVGLRDMADAAFKWAVGDLANYTTKRFSNGRMSELCKEYGISSSVARDCARLARQYDFEQRTQAPWSVHRVAAPLEVDARSKLLTKSIDEGLTVEDVQTEADRIAGKGTRPGSKGAKGGKGKKGRKGTVLVVTESQLARLNDRIQLSESANTLLDEIIDALPAQELEVRESGEGQSLRSESLNLVAALKAESKHLQSLASRLAAAVKLPKGAKRRVLDNDGNDYGDGVIPKSFSTNGTVPS